MAFDKMGPWLFALPVCQQSRHEISRVMYSTPGAVWIHMAKILGIGLLAIMVGCGSGGADQKECIPGDASRADVICSQDGQWVPRPSSVEVLQAPDPTVCPDLAPGSYLLKHTLTSPSSAVDCPAELDEPIVINSDGSITTWDDSLTEKAADSCTNYTTIDGCSRTVHRTCTISGCSTDSLITLDTKTWTGSQSVLLTCPGEGSATCGYDARVVSQ